MGMIGNALRSELGVYFSTNFSPTLKSKVFDIGLREWWPLSLYDGRYVSYPSRQLRVFEGYSNGLPRRPLKWIIIGNLF